MEESLNRNAVASGTSDEGVPKYLIHPTREADASVKPGSSAPGSETTSVSSPRSGQQLLTSMIVDSFCEDESNVLCENVVILTSVARFAG